MVNIKYYLILLICMFLSLGLGMVIGISLQNKNVLEKQHDIIAQRLEDEFSNMRNENRQLKESLKNFEKLESDNARLYGSVFNSIIRNKLMGLKITLIETGGEDDYAGIIDLLKISGASIDSSIVFDATLFKNEYELDNAINVSSQAAIDKGQLYGKLAENVIVTLAKGELTPLIQRLTRLNLIRSPVGIQNGCDTIVLAHTGGDNTREGVEKFVYNLIELIQDYNVNLVVVGKEQDNSLDADWYKNKGISTIDHVDTPYGQLSLISLLYGSQGNYGYGAGTDGILPNELFPQKSEARSMDGLDGEKDDISDFEEEAE